jgi:hypothetical protein
VPELDPRPRPAGSDPHGNGLVADPAFWGPDDRTPRRLRHRRPSVAERLGLAGLGGDARAVLAVAAVIALVAALGSLRATAGSSGPVTVAATPATTTSRGRAGRRTVVVQVAGAVTHPGVVTLPAGSRVVDALDAAGGALAAADLDRLNLAARLRDGQQVLVPTTTTTTTTTTTAAPPAPAG